MSLDWNKLAEPFPDDEVKHRPGAAKWDHKEACQGPRCRETQDASKHHQFSYVDARAVAQRLDDVLTPAGWNFESSVIPGTDVVHGRLSIGVIVREDYGYPNSERDEEPIKAAASDALKRCAVLFGIGRHLYEDNKRPTRTNGHSAPRVTQPVAVAARSTTDVPDDVDWDSLSPVKPAALRQPPTGGGMSYAELADRAKVAGREIKDISEVSKRMYGKDAWKLVGLTAEQRFAVAEEAGLL